MVQNCKLIDTIHTVFYDGTKESGMEVCNAFHEFEWTEWKEPWPSKEKKSEKLIYHSEDGEYDNVVQNNVYIIQIWFGHVIHTDWLTPEKFKNFFEIVES